MRRARCIVARREILHRKWERDYKELRSAQSQRWTNEARPATARSPVEADPCSVLNRGSFGLKTDIVRAFRRPPSYRSFSRSRVSLRPRRGIAGSPGELAHQHITKKPRGQSAVVPPRCRRSGSEPCQTARQSHLLRGRQACRRPSPR